MNKRIIYLDYLRVIACISVVIYHTKMPNDFTEQIVSFLFNFCVPIFLMITGSLLLNKNKEITYTNVLKKYLPKYLSIIFIWGFVYNFISLVIINRIINFNILLKSLLMVVKGDTTFCYQFWYMYILVGLILFLPIIKTWTDKYMADDRINNEGKFCFIIFLLLSIVLPNICNFFSQVNIWHGAFVIFSGFLFYLFCGNFVSKYKILNIFLYLLVILLIFTFLFL